MCDDRTIFGPHPELVGHVGRNWWRVGSNDAANSHEESVARISNTKRCECHLYLPKHSSRSHHVLSKCSHYASLSCAVLEDGDGAYIILVWREVRLAVLHTVDESHDATHSCKMVNFSVICCRRPTTYFLPLTCPSLLQGINLCIVQ